MVVLFRPAMSGKSEYREQDRLDVTVARSGVRERVRD